MFKKIERSSLAEALNNVRQVKFALDGFAADHNGRFPDEDFHETYGTSGSSSNALFRQLFVAGETESEVIFWVKDSPVASANSPDNNFASLAETLQAGENHWAYAHGLNYNSTPETPLILDPYKPGTDGFDPDLWSRKAIVLCVDGSAKTHHMRVSDDKVNNENDVDLFSPKAAVWYGSPPDLRQPEAID